MSSDEIKILLILGGIIMLPLIVVFSVLAVNKTIKKRKRLVYTESTQGTVLKIVNKGLDSPWVIYVSYSVNGISYEIKETAKLKSQTIKMGPMPIGQKKTFVLGPIKERDSVTIYYDCKDPKKAFIYGNDGVMTS